MRGASKAGTASGNVSEQCRERGAYLSQQAGRVSGGAVPVLSREFLAAAGGGGDGAAGRRDVLAQGRGRQRRAMQEFAGARDGLARELLRQRGGQARGDA